MQVRTNTCRAYIIMLYEKCLPKNVFAEIQSPPGENHELMEALKACIRKGQEIELQNVWHETKNPKVLGDYIDIINECDKAKICKE